jgi:transposase-like protein
MSVQQRRKYDPDFKRNAVRLTEEPGRKVADVAENLGISKDLLYRWRKGQRFNKELAFPGNGREALTTQQEKIRELEKKLKNAEMERDILKKAMAIFSRASK